MFCPAKIVNFILTIIRQLYIDIKRQQKIVETGGMQVTPQYEDTIRNRVREIPLKWHEETHGAFTGTEESDFIEMILASDIALSEAKMSLQRWVLAGRRGGLSWNDIGGLLGISKQAAQQRFSDRDATSLHVLKPSDDIVNARANAFTEMGILTTYGLEGYELLTTGPQQLTFRKTNQVWEYDRRVAISSGLITSHLVKKGWTHVSTWFPFHYFKREKT